LPAWRVDGRAGPGILSRLRCVIVDDNRALLESASRLLESEGMSVVGVATTTQEGVLVIEAVRPDVILVDIMLGAESGFELVRRVAGHGEPGCCRTILTSAHDEDDFADLIAASPAIGFLPKAHLTADSIHRLLTERQRFSG
jgi:DNA-binding NarL/FixJ family response regulator